MKGVKGEEWILTLKNEILKAIGKAESNKIKESESSIWEAIKYLKGYDTIENINIE